MDHDGDGKINFEDFSFGFRDFLTPGSRRGKNIPSQDFVNLANTLQAAFSLVFCLFRMNPTMKKILKLNLWR